jgi:hypothetical protein
MANRRVYANRHKRKMIRAIEKGAKLVSRRSLLYRLGGGRDFAHNRMFDPPQSGYWTDCSGYASWLIHLAEKAGGAKLLANGCGSTWSLAEEGLPGESKWLTMFIKNNGGDDQHIILRLRRRWLIQRLIWGEHRWVECGGSDNPRLGNGPAWFHPSESRVREFYIHRRFRAL